MLDRNWFVRSIIRTLNAHSDSQANLAQRAAEIQLLIAHDDVSRALDRLLDFAKDFGSRSDLRLAVVQSNRYRSVVQRIRDFGNTANDSAERNQILASILELIDQVFEQFDRTLQHRLDRDTTGQHRARNAFTAGMAQKVLSGDDSVVLRAQALGVVRRVVDPRFELTDISLDVDASNIVAVVGANGQGKTTLLEILAGRLAHERGALLYPFVEQEWSLIKRYISYMPQSSAVTAGVSEEALRYTAGLYGSLGADNDLVIDYTFARLGLSKYRSVPVTQLSRGYQVRFGLARALLKRPKLLILDEPLAHLDVPTQSRFLGDLRDLSRSPTNPFAVVISSQHLHEIESISDKTLVISDGRTRFWGATKEIGNQRASEVFELLSDRTTEELRNLLSELGECSLEMAGANALIRLPLGTTSVHLLRHLISKGVRVCYFRDVGNSARPMLGDDL